MNSEIKLVKLNDCDTKELYDMYQNIPKKELGTINKLNGLDFKTFEKILKDYINEEKVINKQLNTTVSRYILFVNSKPIGEIGIRTTMNDYWINYGSQIFYKIRKDYRGKGYGNIILNLGLKKAKELGFDKIRVNCDNNNIPSKKAIIKNGGIVDIENYATSEGISSSYIIYLDNNNL